MSEGLKDEVGCWAGTGLTEQVRRTCNAGRKASSQRIPALMSKTREGDGTRREQEWK